MAGETALARQLKKLAIPQTSLLLQNKIRKSLLFDHRFAATLDRDVIFAHGISGLEKLIEINPEFNKFKQNLFNNNYAELERSVQTASFNKKLDDKIITFLRMLSPYFLNAASAQALEWLVYRYHIHLYNSDALLATALPHYNTPHFVRVVQLLNLEDEKSRWAWLKPVQKSGEHLEYPVILNHFISDGGFRTFVCDMAPNVLKVYKSNTSAASIVISFSMQTMYNALDKNVSISDSTIIFYIPYILMGLKSNITKYTAGCYLLLANIVTKAKLNDKFLDNLLVKVFKNVNEDLLYSAFELLLLVYQQQPIRCVTKQLCNVLLSNLYCIKNLMSLTEWDDEPFTKLLIKRLISTLFDVCNCEKSRRKGRRRVFKFCKNLLSNVKLSEKSATLCLKFIFKNFLKYSEMIKSKKQKIILKKFARVLLKQIEVKYPNSFDKVINSYLNSKDEIINRQVGLLINDSICNVKNSVLPDSQTTLVLGLNHANENIRRISVQFLLQKDKYKKLADVDFIGNVLCLKLLDKSPTVLQEILKFPKVLFQYVEKQKVLFPFANILQRDVRKKSEWYPVQMACIDILCTYFTNEYALEVFVVLMPFIFPLKKSSVLGYFKILNSKLRNILPIIEVVKLPDDLNIDAETVDNAMLTRLNSSILFAVNKHIFSLSTTQKTSFLSFLAKKCVEMPTNSLYAIYMLSAERAVISDEGIEHLLIWAKQLLCFLNMLLSQNHLNLNFEPFVADASEEIVFENITNSLIKKQVPTTIIYSILYNIVKYMKLDFTSTNLKCWLKADNISQFLSFETLLHLFDFCIQQINCSKPLLSKAFQLIFSQFLSSQFLSTQHLFYFLSALWSNVPKNISAVIQASALCIAKTLCLVPLRFNWFFENNVMCLSLLKAVSSPMFIVRDAALSLLLSLLECSKDSEIPLKHLCNEIQKNSEEIKVDYRQSYYVIHNWLSTVTDQLSEEITSQSLKSDLHDKRCILDIFIERLSDDQTPMSIRYEILLYLQQVDSFYILSTYVPVIKTFIKDFTENKDLSDTISLNMVELLLQKFTPKSAACLKENCVETDCFLECLTFYQNFPSERGIQVFALSALSQKFFTAVPSVTVQKRIFETLLDLYVTSPPSINVTVKKVLGKLSTYAYLMLKDFQENESHNVATLKDVKRSRIKITQESSTSFDGMSWKKLSLLLEIIQNKSKLDRSELIIPELFTILNKTLNVDSQSSVEYLRQMILSTIYNCCHQLGSTGLDETQFQVELVVQCIRSSRSPKTHQQSLLLLNLAATLFPDYVLNNVMSIFTFMGSSLIRQDDSYSFQVISQTIETIVPSLLEASSHQKDSDTVQIVAEVIRVFVDSLTDIPRHRQMPLFTKLITNLDPSRFLWIPLGQICDQYATVFHDVISEDVNNWKISPTLEFAVNLHKQFSPFVQIDTCINLLNFLIQLPDNKEESGQINSFKEPFNIKTHSNQQLQIYKHNVLSYINIWLSSHAFICQVSELDLTTQHNLEEKYVSLLETALNYLQHQRSVDRGKSGHNLFQLLFDLVCHVNSLLPSNLFIRVVLSLLKNPEPEIRNKAVEILNTKLEQQQHVFREENHKYLLKLLKPLLRVINNYINSDSKHKGNSISQQTILYALHLLTKIIGPTYPTKFHKVLNVTVHILANSHNQELVVNALLCLAQLCCSLNIEVLPQLNTFMPAIIDLLTDNKIVGMNDCLVLGVITALQSLIENLGTFLSSYMQPLVTGVCLLSAKYQEAGKKAIYEKFLALQTLLAKAISLRILLTALQDSYSSLTIICPQAVVPLMQVLDEKLNCCTYEDIKASLTPLESLYISLLDFRFVQIKSSKLSVKLIVFIETSIINALKTFVMKLSVNIFEKFFRKIFQWVSNVAEEEEQKCRVYTFYGLTSQLSESLKSLFVVVAKCFLKNASATLDLINCSKNKNQFPAILIDVSFELLQNILITLNNCFVYDDGHLLDKENFELLMQPLIDQLENCSDSNLQIFKERISKHLSGAISHFMAAVSDNTLWKKCNYQILLKTRHDSAAVRFAAIQVIREVVKVMGDSYLVLLPESIPFLAEVMEDESSEVEQECQSVILEMEKILGEPIRKYF